MSTQTENYLEFHKEKEKSMDILLKARELSIIYNIKLSLQDKLTYCNLNVGSEFDYCEIRGRITTLEEIIKELDEQIKNLKNA